MNNLQALPEARLGGVHGNVKAGKFVRLVAPSGPKAYPSVAEQIEGGHIFGQPHRIVDRQDADPDAQAQAGGALGDGGQQHLGRRKHPLAGLKVVLADPESLVAEFLGILGLVQDLVVELFV